MPLVAHGGLCPHDSGHVIANRRRTAGLYHSVRGELMNTTTIIIIIVVLLLLGGGWGFTRRGRM
jgi:hypothetical protein